MPIPPATKPKYAQPVLPDLSSSRGNASNVVTLIPIVSAALPLNETPAPNVPLDIISVQGFVSNAKETVFHVWVKALVSDAKMDISSPDKVEAPQVFAKLVTVLVKHAHNEPLNAHLVQTNFNLVEATAFL